MSVHLVDSPPHGASTTIEASALLELPAHGHRGRCRAMGHGGGLVCKRRRAIIVMDRRIMVNSNESVLTLPFQVNRDMHLAHGLQVHPKVLLLLFAVREVLERDIAVGHKVVGRNRGVVEHG